MVYVKCRIRTPDFHALNLLVCPKDKGFTQVSVPCVPPASQRPGYKTSEPHSGLPHLLAQLLVQARVIQQQILEPQPERLRTQRLRAHRRVSVQRFHHRV